MFSWTYCLLSSWPSLGSYLHRRKFVSDVFHLWKTSENSIITTFTGYCFLAYLASLQRIAKCVKFGFNWNVFENSTECGTNLQCRWQFWGDLSNKSYPVVERPGRMEAASHLQVILWNWRRIFSIRWADMCHEVWILDLWWLPGQPYKKIARKNFDGKRERWRR